MQPSCGHAVWEAGCLADLAGPVACTRNVLSHAIAVSTIRHNEPVEREWPDGLIPTVLDISGG